MCIVFVTFLFCSLAGAIRFYIPQSSEPTCVYDEFVVNDVVHVTFLIPPLQNAAFGPIWVMVNAPDGTVPHFTSALSTTELINGTFAFAADQNGEYTFCFHPQLNTGVQEKLHCTFHIAGHQVGRLNDNLTHAEELHNNLNRVKAMSEKMKDVASEVVKNEKSLRPLSERLFERIPMMTLFTCLSMILSGIFQVYSLRRYFKSKKLLS
eukprot:TRINITY_DN473_c0_g1_i14.p1 TRINITY_DN473_c0_g1~~TRINITY_DN473_c0_g1_i14.p1  ORF type:complete len:208 (+),score=15.04 TRINITY_DN473_c0_g1_i14:108-731(+)